MGARTIRLIRGLRRRLGRNERGATSVEYALIASVVSITAFVALVGFGGQTGAMYGIMHKISDAITSILGG
jgi:Flp pilus assembly pilin Flp